MQDSITPRLFETEHLYLSAPNRFQTRQRGRLALTVLAQRAKQKDILSATIAEM